MDVGKRLTLKAAQEHDWTTMEGAEPMEKVVYEFVTVTQEEVDQVVKRRGAVVTSMRMSLQRTSTQVKSAFIAFGAGARRASAMAMHRGSVRTVRKGRDADGNVIREEVHRTGCLAALCRALGGGKGVKPAAGDKKKSLTHHRSGVVVPEGEEGEEAQKKMIHVSTFASMVAPSPEPEETAELDELAQLMQTPMSEMTPDQLQRLKELKGSKRKPKARGPSEADVHRTTIVKKDSFRSPSGVPTNEEVRRESSRSEFSSVSQRSAGPAGKMEDGTKKKLVRGPGSGHSLVEAAGDNEGTAMAAAAAAQKKARLKKKHMEIDMMRTVRPDSSDSDSDGEYGEIESVDTGIFDTLAAESTDSAPDPDLKPLPGTQGIEGFDGTLGTAKGTQEEGWLQAALSKKHGRDATQYYNKRLRLMAVPGCLKGRRGYMEDRTVVRARLPYGGAWGKGGGDPATDDAAAGELATPVPENDGDAPKTVPAPAKRGAQNFGEETWMNVKEEPAAFPGADGGADAAPVAPAEAAHHAWVGVYDGHGGNLTSIGLQARLHRSAASVLCADADGNDGPGIAKYALATDQIVASQLPTNASSAEILPTLVDYTHANKAHEGHVGIERAVEAGDRAEMWRVVAAMRSAFHDTDDALLAEHRRTYQVNKKESVSGSTCIGLLFWAGDSRPNSATVPAGDGPLAPLRVAVGNLGDCRAVVSRAGRALALSADHKPTLEVEKNRIEAAGGWIGSKRINGVIAVSRAFGDIEYKTFKDKCWGWDRTFKADLITCDPDVRVAELDPLRDEFMIVACDGLWDVFSSQEAINFVRRRLYVMLVKRPAEHDWPTQEILQHVVDELVAKAIAMGSVDNTSACIVALNV